NRNAIARTCRKPKSTSSMQAISRWTRLQMRSLHWSEILWIRNRHTEGCIFEREKGGTHMRSDIVPGAVFPDYELPDHTAKRRKLSELQGEDPMILVLSRGSFCPKDRRQHEGLVQLHRELEVGYCRLITISIDNIIETNEYRSGVGAHWPFLSDPARKVQKDLDIAEYTDPLHN